MIGEGYGGDKIGALVFDIGHYSTRAGYAGDDTPKADVPSMIGVLEETASENVEVDSNTTSIPNDNMQKRYFFDSTGIHFAKKGMELQSFLNDGMIEDWDMFEKYLDFMYVKCLKLTPNHHPVLMTEPSWNVRAKREKLTELMFEKYNVPAFFLAKNALLAAFASGRSTAIVVDSGASQTSVVPVYDGLVLTEAIVKSPLAGDFISMQCKQYFEENNIEVIPPYMIASKEKVKAGESPKWIKKTNLPEVTKSWDSYMIKEVLQDFQNSVLQIHYIQFKKEDVESMPAIHYEFPNGYNQGFGPERFQIPEALFDPSNTGGVRDPTIMGIGQLVTTSFGKCDIDVQTLCNSVVVTGGNTLFRGFNERLHNELSAKIPPNRRLQIFSAYGSTKRRFASWIGGSTLTSLGSFQQMWISKQEYDEKGKTLIDRCY